MPVKELVAPKYVAVCDKCNKESQRTSKSPHGVALDVSEKDGWFIDYKFRTFGIFCPECKLTHPKYEKEIK